MQKETRAQAKYYYSREEMVKKYLLKWVIFDRNGFVAAGDFREDLLDELDKSMYCSICYLYVTKKK